MNSGKWAFLFGLFLTHAACSPVLGGAGGQKTDLATFLPAQEELEIWQADGDPQVFRGQELFVYMDGGADLYLEYGFVQLLVQDYKDSSGHGVSLEIFELTSPESAFGIFTCKTNPGDKELKLGDHGRLADYYLNLNKDRFVITITALEPDQTQSDSLLSLARSVNAKIVGSASKPEFLRKLPADGLRSETIKFFKGPLGLANAERILAGAELGFLRGVKGEYLSGHSLLLIEFPNPKEASIGFRSAVEFLAAKESFKNFESRCDRFKVEDDRSRKIAGRLAGKFHLLCLGGENWQEIGLLLEELAQMLKRG